jgi:hypothetical protein
MTISRRGALGDAERAAVLYAELAPSEGNLMAPPNVACFGAASRHLGLLAATMKRWPDAERHFEAALAMNARQGARPWLAHTQHLYAAMLLARSASGDRERAVALLDEGRGSAGDRLRSEERAAALREEAAAPDGVTRRSQPPRIECCASSRRARETARSPRGCS